MVADFSGADGVGAEGCSADRYKADAETSSEIEIPQPLSKFSHAWLLQSLRYAERQEFMEKWTERHKPGSFREVSRGQYAR